MVFVKILLVANIFACYTYGPIGGYIGGYRSLMNISLDNESGLVSCTIYSNSKQFNDAIVSAYNAVSRFIGLGFFPQLYYPKCAFIIETL